LFLYCSFDKTIINAKPTRYTIEELNIEFNNLLEVYKFCKKQAIDGEFIISSNLCQWGKVKALISMKLKNVKEIL
jgi:hypothetical protein